MLFSSQSSEQLNLSATSLNPSALQPDSSTVSPGLADPIQQSSLRLGSSASSIAATTELTPLSAPSGISSSALVNKVSVPVLDTLPSSKFRTGVDLLEENLYHHQLKYSLDPALDDTFAGAFDMGRLDGKTLSRLSSIGSDDSVDYTHFHLDGASSFNLFLKGTSGDAAVNLLDTNGTKIASSYDGNRLLAEGISTTQNYKTHDVSLNLSSLAAGDYYLEVSPFWSMSGVKGDFNKLYLPTAVTTDYKLSVSTEQVSNLLPTEVDLGSLAGTRLLKGSLDSNNTSEMYRLNLGASNLHITLSGMNANADVRLIKDSNNDGLASAKEVLTSSNQGFGFTDGIYNALNEGTYFIQVNQGQDAAGVTINYNLGISTGDWYTDNLSDYGVIAEARLGGADGFIDRNEMISILRGTENYSVIDATELTDLRTVLSGLGHAMSDSVRNLTNKVINGDPANTRLGGNLGGINNGNLFGGDSSGMMEGLIGKWFLGNDRPVADMTTTYQRANGSLFADGISWQDVDQGGVGDCYFLAGLAAVARTDHTIIDSMITDNGDDTFTVRFYNNGNADYVTVDRFLPTQGNSFFYANNSSGKKLNDNTNELWAALVEKAYAQVNESGWLARDNTNSYAGINSGFLAPVLSQITGRGNDGNRNVSSGTWLWEKDDIGYIINASNANKPVVLGSSSDTDDSRIVSTHAYTLVDYDAGTDRFTLFNPWGTNVANGIVSLSKDEVIDNFTKWSTTV